MLHACARDGYAGRAISGAPRVVLAMFSSSSIRYSTGLGYCLLSVLHEKYLHARQGPPWFKDTYMSYPDRECPPLLPMRRPHRVKYSSRVEDDQAAAEGLHIDGATVLDRRAVPPG